MVSGAVKEPHETVLDTRHAPRWRWIYDIEHGYYAHYHYCMGVFPQEPEPRPGLRS